MRRRISFPVSPSLVAVALLAPLLAVAGCGDDGAAPSDAGADGESPVAATVEPAPDQAAVVRFLADDIKVAAGGCTSLTWETAGALRVYLDGAGVDPTGAREVCPETTTTYVLTATFDAGDETREVTVAVDSPTAEPATATTAPSTALPVTAAPTRTPQPTAVPTEAVFISFYPDNGVFDLPKDQTCTAVNWETRGVTEVQLERGALGRSGVAAAGRQEACFSEKELVFRLHFKQPDGRDDMREFTLRHK